MENAEIVMFENHTTANMVHTKTSKSVKIIESHAAQTLRMSQKDAKNALKLSQKENAEMLILTHEKYLAFSMDLQKKGQLILDRLRRLAATLTYNPAIHAISQELQSTLDSITDKVREFRAWEAFEATQLILLQQTKAVELNDLHESQAKKLCDSKN